MQNNYLDMKVLQNRFDKLKKEVLNKDSFKKNKTTVLKIKGNK